jgi:hypothetical protein
MAPRKPTHAWGQPRMGDAISTVVVVNPNRTPSVIFSKLPVSSVRSIPRPLPGPLLICSLWMFACTLVYEFYWPGGSTKRTKRMGKTNDRTRLKIHTNRRDTRTVNVAWYGSNQVILPELWGDPRSVTMLECACVY